MRDTVYFLVFDGFADWQAALALCEIRRPGDWEVRTVGFSRATVTSMGGLAVKPDLALEQIELARAALLIVPGGHLWLRGEDGVPRLELIGRGCMPPAAPACARSSRCACRSGVASGRSAHGVGCAGISAISAPTASVRGRRLARSSPMPPSAVWPPICAPWAWISCSCGKCAAVAVFNPRPPRYA
ncbi:DJ-1/PfpI family protein [Rhodanobacter lindaniclasticus]